MTGYDLKLWRRGQLWTQERAAREFGVSLATYKRYEKGAPPRVIDLAIRALTLADDFNEYQQLDKEQILGRLKNLC